MENQFLPVNFQIDIMSLFRERKAEMLSMPSIKKRVYEKHDYIYHFGDYANEIFIIDQGRVKVENNLEDDKTIIKNVFRAGELFGEVSLMGETFRVDFAIAMEKTELYIFSLDELYRKMQDNRKLTAYMINLLATRLSATEEKITSFIFKTARARIIDFLYELVEKRGQKVGYEILVRQFFTHQEIANITATSRQTVTGVLNDLRNKKILSFDRRRLLIRDLNSLRMEAY